MIGTSSLRKLGRERSSMSFAGSPIAVGRGAHQAHRVQPVAMEASGAQIAHEVTQPLTAILFNAETALTWLTSDPPNLEAAKRAVERVIGNGHRAGGIVKSIRESTGKKCPAMADVHIDDVIECILDLSSSELCKHGITVETVLVKSLPPIKGDRGLLERVVSNLVSNAIEAMSSVQDRGRRLQVSAKQNKGGGVLVSVQDSGTGLDPANLGRIFEPLFTTKREGMGLGLSICRSIVEAHGGRLWGATNLPHGSIFSFIIPAIGQRSVS